LLHEEWTFLDGVIVEEVKAIIDLQDIHLAKTMNYVEACNLEIR